MTPERLRQIEELYHSARDCEPGERGAFLTQACTGDEELRREVESLLGQDGGQGPLERPAAEVAASLLDTRITVGARLGPYQIIAPIGKGGMAEVYRALDTRLGRDVAIKVSQERFSARFEREARAIAALNHSNICTLYDIGPDYLVMELVEGETLAQRIERGPVPLEEALGVAKQIAEALEAAHEKGIVHRDLKPGNVKIGPKGVVKVLDFGLAKVADPSPSADPDNSPTLTMATEAGMIMGTAAYMSPEQASGKTVDRRADVWSFGVVLWELLTRKKLFQAETVSHTLANVLLAEIDFNQLPPATPAPIRDLLRRCLDRDTNSRLRDMGEARVAIQKYLANPASASQPQPATPPRRRLAWVWLAAGAMVLLGVVAAARHFNSDRGKSAPSPEPPKQIATSLPAPTSPAPPPAAPTVAAAPVNPESNKPIPGPEQWKQMTNFPDAATSPALSRDGRMLAFTRGSGWWMGKNQIYGKVLPDGPAVQYTDDESAKMFPQFSPDGSRIAYSVGGWDTWAVPVMGGGQPQLMLSSAEGLTWIDPHRIMFSEPKRPGFALETSLENRTSQREVYTPKAGEMEHFSFVSPDGKQILAVEMAPSRGWNPCRLLPFDGSSPGRQVGPPAPAQCTAAAWSPDGKWMYFTANDDKGSHIWRQRADSGKLEQLTFGLSSEQGLAIAPDGLSLYTSVGSSHTGIWLHDAKGEREISGEGIPDQPFFSPDGARIYYFLVLKRNEGAFVATDLKTGRTAPAVPSGVPSVGAAMTRDGKFLTYWLNDGSVWLTSLEPHSSARKLPLKNVDHNVQLGLSGKLYFTAKEGAPHYLFSMNLDGSERRKLLPDPINDGGMISPDEHWATNKIAGWWEVRPLGGGDPRRICKCFGFAWSTDGKAARFIFRGLDGETDSTVAVPLKPGEMLPPLPPGGFQSSAEVAKLPGALVIPTMWADVGPGMSSYAYLKDDTRQNIFQIPLR